MLRIVIVDDEASIREGLAKIINKENSGFIVAGIFPNGQEALSFIESSQISVDVVITDIRMPLVDGLELIKQLKSIEPDIRCLIMSGFTDFEYARQALRYSAVDYLLKPINKKQLFKLLYELEEERVVNLNKEQRYRSGVLLSYLKSSTSLCSKLPELNLQFAYFTVHALRSRDIELLYDQLRLAVLDIAVPIDIVDTGDGTLSMISYYSQEPCVQLIKELADQLRPALVTVGFVHVGSSRAYQQVTQLSEAYNEAVQACDYGLYEYSAWSYWHYDDLLQPEPDITALFISTRERLSEQMQILNISQIKTSLEKWFGEVKQAKASRQSIILLCRLIFDAALAELPEWRAFHDSEIEEQLKEQILSCLAFEEIKSLFFSFFLNGLERIRASRLQMADRSVEAVKHWIHKNYDQQAELSSLASMVYLTPSYLSKLFKQETGMTITDYLIEVRLKKAKLLLKTCSDMKIHEIGCEVGYPDPSYFNKLFKRIVGVTPNEYKKLNQLSSSLSKE
ncbi:response regulator [Paenibacillus lentus]|uniref:Response regulator n=1 Tax=Paenibacillus lentus TaxID=1338368 RepID=A0A3Q8S6D4_9BACL|nr:response regulator [Paenibacillus lentus]AZK48399.1 response regulator [Paenibacillus lentus]